jgi:hypothetical protein
MSIEADVEVRDRPAIADCDIHHSPKTFRLIYP